jgi:antitoxin component YwqK of YwqJK toxin-antitoxin module
LEPEGPVVDFDSKGLKRAEYIALKGKMLGPVIAWHPNGKRCIQAGYTLQGALDDDNFGRIERKPWLHGPATEWFSNGQKRIEGAFKRGDPHGVFRAWAPGHPEVVRRECSWLNGWLEGEWKSFYPNGQPEIRLSLAKGRVNGQVVHWASNGQKIDEFTLVDERLNGLRQKWDAQGTLLLEASYVLGREDGPFKEFYASGKPRLAAIYKDGQLEGPRSTWFENGRLETTGAYAEGNRHGLWKTWHENGQLQRVSTYDNGRELPGWKTYYSDGTVSGSLSRSGAFEEFFPGGSKSAVGIIGRYGREGKWAWYYENGKPWKIGSYRENWPHGEFVWLDEDGRVEKRVRFRNGLFASLRCPKGANAERDESGSDLRVLRCIDNNGEPHGPMYVFDVEARYSVENYQHGVLHGVYRNGPEEYHYVQGLRQGATIGLFEGSDQKMWEGQYDKGKKTGNWTTWYAEGKVASKGRYVEGLRDGVWEFFRKDGSSWLIVTFAKGKVSHSRGFDPSGAEVTKPDELPVVLAANPQEAQEHLDWRTFDSSVVIDSREHQPEGADDAVCLTDLSLYVDLPPIPRVELTLAELSSSVKGAGVGSPASGTKNSP